MLPITKTNHHIPATETTTLANPNRTMTHILGAIGIVVALGLFAGASWARGLAIVVIWAVATWKPSE